MNLRIAFLSAIAVFATTTTAAQTMFKCVQDGRTVYQAQPCPETAKQDTLKTAVTPPTGASADIDSTIEFMSTYRACADAITVWGQEMAGPYEAWRSRNSAMVSRVENDRQLRASYQQRVDAKRNGKARMCRDVALELRGVKQ
jgi:hypothetical protein